MKLTLKAKGRKIVKKSYKETGRMIGSANHVPVVQSL